ncbi:Yip1 family protein [Kroppenstedtia eburnea]|uniref:Yip1 family protein n=1 Tax=Kroppenstedtia eburnea TaxID=714067 RepID=UPI0036379601
MRNPLLTIWRHPRETLQEILDTRWSSFVWLIPIVYLIGIYDMFSLSLRNNTGDTVTLPSLIILSFIFAIFWGPMSWGLDSLLYWGMGRILRGTGEWRESSVAAGWSKVPLIITLFTYWLPMILLYGRGFFQTETPPQSLLQGIFTLILYPLWIAIFVYYVYITSQILAEAHEFESGWKGFLVYILSKLVYIIALLFIFVLYELVS